VYTHTTSVPADGEQYPSCHCPPSPGTQSCRRSVPWTPFRHSQTLKHSSVWRMDRALTLCDRPPICATYCSNCDQQSGEELENLRRGIHKHAHTPTHNTHTLVLILSDLPAGLSDWQNVRTVTNVFNTPVKADLISATRRGNNRFHLSDERSSEQQRRSNKADKLWCQETTKRQEKLPLVQFKLSVQFDWTHYVHTDRQTNGHISWIWTTFYSLQNQ